MEAYHYTECGLDNVLIQGMIPCKDDEGDDVFAITNVLGLHKVITESIVGREAGMTGAELRFIRTEVGMTQAELAKVVHHDAQSVGRWERNEFPIDQNAEALIRLLAIEKLGLTVDGKTVSALSERCVPSAASKQIVIDGHDPSHYKQLVWRRGEKPKRLRGPGSGFEFVPRRPLNSVTPPKQEESIIIDGEQDEIRFLVTARGAGAYRRYHRSGHVSGYGRGPNCRANGPRGRGDGQANNPRSMVGRVGMFARAAMSMASRAAIPGTVVELLARATAVLKTVGGVSARTSLSGKPALSVKAAAQPPLLAAFLAGVARVAANARRCLRYRQYHDVGRH